MTVGCICVSATSSMEHVFLTKPAKKPHLVARGTTGYMPRNLCCCSASGLAAARDTSKLGKIVIDRAAADRRMGRLTPRLHIAGPGDVRTQMRPCQAASPAMPRFGDTTAERWRARNWRPGQSRRPATACPREDDRAGASRAC
jgi:hypothetical protein